MIKQFIYFVYLGISPVEEVLKDMDEEPQEEVPEDMDEKPQTHCLLECIQKEVSKVVNGKKEPSLCFNFVPSCKTCLWNPLANTSKKEPNLPDYCPSYRSLSELKVKGIHFKSIDSSPHSLKKRKSYSVLDIEFIPGFFYSQLELPHFGPRSAFSNIVEQLDSL